MHRGWLPMLLLAGCDFSADPVAADAPVQLPPAFMISGTTSSIGVSGAAPLGNATVEAYSDRSTNAVGTTASSTEGVFSLALTQDGGAITYLRAVHTDYLATYLFFAQPIV